MAGGELTLLVTLFTWGLVWSRRNERIIGLQSSFNLSFGGEPSFSPPAPNTPKPDATDPKNDGGSNFYTYTLGDREVQVCNKASCRDSCRSRDGDSAMCGCSPQCKLQGRCCLDYEWYCKKDVKIRGEAFTQYLDNITDVILRRTSRVGYECREVQLFQEGSGFYMVTSCPSGSKMSDEILCSIERKTSLLDVTPVNIGDMLYKNIYCARCNEVNSNISEFKSWQPIIRCSNQDEANRILKHEGSAALINYALNDRFCTIEFAEPSTNNAKCKFSLINRCPARTNPVLTRLCSSYAANLAFNVSGTMASYKNPHCAICNGVDTNASATCKKIPDLSSAGSQKIPVFPSFSILLDVRNPENTNIKARSCAAGYRRIDDRCYKIQCAEGYKIEGQRCVPDPDTAGNVRGVFIKASISVTNHSIGPTVTALNVLSYVSVLFPTFSDSFTSCDRPYRDNGTITMCVMAELNLQTGLTLLNQLKILAINGQLWMSKGMAHSTVSVFSFRPESNQTCLINEKLNTYLGNISGTDLFTSKNKTPPLLIGGAFNLTLLIEDAGRQVEYTLKVCEEMMTCSWVMRNATDLEWRNGSVWMEHLNRSLNQHEFLNESDQVRICSDLLILYEEKDENYIQVIVQGALTLACNIISMTSLVLTFVVYCLLPRLRTLAGQETMNLCVALFFAQLSFQIGPLMQTIRVACQIMASLQHFFWLAAFSWMNSLLFNIAKTFGGSDMSSGGNSKGILWYAAFSWGVPLTFVVILYSLQANGVYDVGYGSAFCWMSNNSLIYFFVIPLACQILANIILFVISAVGLYKSMKIAKRAKSEKEQMKADRARLLAYLKLSSIMGFTWIFGFLANINSASFLAYGFIVFSTLQGLFIMFSFVSSRRVLNMLGKRLGITCLDSDGISSLGSHTKSQAATTISTVNRSVANKL